MQQCQFCGADLPEGTRFCGNCGRVPAAASQPGASMAQGGSQANRMPAAGPAPFASPYPGYSQAASQQPQPQASFPQPVPQDSAQRPQGSQFRPSPFQSQEAGQAQGQGLSPAQFQSSQPQQFQQPRMPENPAQFSQQQRAAAKAAPGSVPGWLLIAIIGVIVIAVGAGALVLLRHASGSPSTGPNAGVSANPTPKFTPVSSCLANASHAANLTFSGDVAGSMATSQFMACGPLTYQGQQGYVGNASGTIGGTNYSFIFAALAYNGPGTYTFPKIAATLNKQGSTQKTWEIDPTAGGSSITINSDGKSGTLDLHLFDPTNIGSRVSVTGNWSST